MQNVFQTVAFGCLDLLQNRSCSLLTREYLQVGAMDASLASCLGTRVASYVAGLHGLWSTLGTTAIIYF